MACLQNNRDDNSLCRDEAREYLGCRMEHNLMAKEEWTKLGYQNKHESADLPAEK